MSLRILPFILLLLFIRQGAEGRSPLVRKHAYSKHHKISGARKRRVGRLLLKKRHVEPFVDSRSWRNNRADNLATSQFVGMRGRMPWPVESKAIAMHFGLQVYGEKVHYNNRGITVDVKPGSLVRSVHQGVVANVFEVGDVQAVTIRHGNYLTTYSNFSVVEVRAGEEVSTGCVLGQIGDAGQLEFVLSDERYRYFDPEKWLKR